MRTGKARRPIRVESSSSGGHAAGKPDCARMDAKETDRPRENVNEMYRFVLEELQKESLTATGRKMIATGHYGDLVA